MEICRLTSAATNDALISRIPSDRASASSASTNPLTSNRLHRKVPIRFSPTMLAFPLTPSAVASSSSTILQFPTDATRAVRSLRNMTTQLLHEAAKVIPNQQLLINVVSKRVRQLGLGHRPLVEVTSRASLTDIALKEIIAGKLTFERLKDATEEA